MERVVGRRQWGGCLGKEGKGEEKNGGEEEESGREKERGKGYWRVEREVKKWERENECDGVAGSERE